MQDWRASTKIHRRQTVSREYADLCSARIKQLIILLACCALVASSYSEFTLSFMNQFASVYSFCLFVMAFALVLPTRFFLLSIPLAAGALTALSRMNELKISAVSLPITFFDVKTVIADPVILVNALGIRNDLYRMVSATAGLLILALLAAAFYKIRNYSFLDHLKRLQSTGEDSRRSSSLVFKAVTILVVLIAAQMCLARYGRFVHANLNTIETKLWQELWLPSTQVTLSRKLGLLEYIAFSSFAADEMDIALEPGPPPTVEAMRVAAAEFVNSSVPPSKALLPNIVFFHAESTFDPNLAFKLYAPLDLPLWSKRNETRALSPVRVNIIGGGSWITEFEVITGVDSRIFGYQGFYTHYYIAPKVKNSFAKYLIRKGYKTAAFYPVEGSFYNAQEAFKSYGFKEFIDGRALGLPEDWGNLIDRNIIKAVIERGAFEVSDPFFYFIGTSENHGPHPCRSFDSEQQFLTRFAAKVSFQENCQLNEYLRRAISTSDAFELVLKQLKKIERQTGRPFVLLIYGDHQPWSFTGGIYSIPGGNAAEGGFNNFSGVRTDANKNQTFFHLLASDNAVLRGGFTKAPPVSLLPTVVSAFVATSHDDLYLPMNFVAYASCGSDIRASDCQLYAELARSARHSLLNEPASVALPSAEARPQGSLSEPRLIPAFLQ
jgi:phosphoglycerol transferase MdoB-like AlkP superfamily enzyme